MHECTSGLISEKSPPWSDEECKNFEHALQMYDKNFHLIQKHKVSVELVFLADAGPRLAHACSAPLPGYNTNRSRMCGVLLHVEKV